MPIKTILGYLPDTLLERLAVEHRVDRQARKLKGAIVFKLLLYGVLSSSSLSLNVLIALFDKIGFAALLGVGPGFATRRNSLADRLCRIDSEYGRAVFDESVRIFSKLLPGRQLHGYNPHLFDSTVVSCSAKLLDWGMRSGRKPKDPSGGERQVKFTVGFNGTMAESVRFYDQQTHLSDEVPLKEAVGAVAFSARDVAVFDRGLKARKTFDHFSQDGPHQRLFVCRINPTARYQLVGQKPLAENGSDTLDIHSDMLVRLTDQKGRLTKAVFRLIVATKKHDPQEPAHQEPAHDPQMFFLTNIIDDLEPWQVADIYRCRWEIEKFFRFIKQNLNFSHLISRDYNAIKLMTYVMLTAAILIAVYAHLNDKKGYKIVKLNFFHELEAEIVNELIIRCNGDPSLLKYILDYS